jgi:hypothetical protein
MKMTRSLIVAAAFGVLIAGSAQAQTIGFKLGPSFSTVSTDAPDVNVNTLTRFTGGGFVRFGFGGLSLQPELMYVTKGFSTTFTEEGQTVDVDFRLDYIEIPVLLVLPIPTATGISPFLYAGPAFAFEVGCKIAGSGGGISATVDCDADGEDFFERNKFDVGAMLGGGVALPMGPGAVTLEGRYNFGLININKTDGDDSMKNRSGAVLVGYSIPIGIR